MEKELCGRVGVKPTKTPPLTVKGGENPIEATNTPRPLSGAQLCPQPGAELRQSKGEATDTDGAQGDSKHTVA